MQAPFTPDPDPQRAWRECLSSVDDVLRRQVADTVTAAAVAVADNFYARMLADPAASRLLDHAVVHERLHAMMVRWLCTLFAPNTPLADIVATQRHTGEVHARIGVPMDLVAQGARLIKRDIVERLGRSRLPRERLAEAIRFVYEWVDLAIDAMGLAFASDTHRMARSDEAYRLFFLNQDMKAERERQRSQLLEWANQILLSTYWASDGAAGAPAACGFGSSEFGLWLQHKASMLFETAPELLSIQRCTDHIERDLLPRLAEARDNHGQAREIVARINQHIDEVKRLLGSMFDRTMAVEDGRDSTTRLLNRRWFASVARREIALAQRRQGAFALLMIDIDHFDRVHDALGLEGSDRMLADLADSLQDGVRAGDFVFRIGDDQFLALLVEASQATLATVADALRARVEALRLRAPGRSTTSITVCIGAVMYDGHPDYQRLLDRADAALRAAQQGGANRCVVGD